jgi:hypothetical protein
MLPAVMLLLAVSIGVAIVVPSAVAAKKPKQDRIAGVAVDDTGLPIWLSESIGPRDDDATIGEFAFPATLDSVMKLDQDKGWVGFTMLGAPKKIRRETHRRGVVYRTRTYDVVQHVKDDDRMREVIVVRKRQGIRTWRWQLQRSGPGIPPRLTDDGQVVIGDNAYIERPALHRFNGGKFRDLRWTLRGNVLELRVDDRRLAVPYVIDPPIGADTTPPVVTFDGFVENTPADTHVNATGNTLYYRPNTVGNFGMRFRATDAQSLIDYVRFPNLGAGWTPGGDDTSGFSGASALPNSGTGLNASYQNYMAPPCGGMSPPSAAGFSGVGFTRIDGPINFNWGGTGHPDTTGYPTGATGIQADCFTVRWMGYFEAPTTGNYWFRTQSDDGVRLWVDGYLSNDFWTEHATQVACGGQVHGRHNNTTVVANPAGVSLTAGQRVPIVMDFNENGGQAVIGLQYRTNAYTNNTNAATGCNAAWNSGGWTIIPASRLYTAEQYEWTYSWTAGPTPPPAGLGVTARDAAGNVSTPKNFAVIPDPNPPTGGALAHATGLQTATSVNFTTVNRGTDVLTTVVPDWRIEARTRPLVNNACLTGVWTSYATVATNPAQPYNLTGLTGGLCYEFQLVSLDGVGNAATFPGSGVVRIDNASPTGVGPVNDGTVAGTDIDYITTTPISATWTLAADVQSGVADLEWCIGTGANATGCTGTGGLQAFTNVTGGVTATADTRTGLTLTDGTTYYVCVRAQDVAANPWTIACSDGQRYDSTPPMQPASINDGAAADIDWQASLTTAQANWPAATDPHSGIAGYQTCVTTSATGADCAGAALAPWNATTAPTSQSRTGLTLAMATTYYFCVRAENNAGLLGAPPHCSDGFQIDSIGPVAPATVFDVVPVPLTDQDWTSSTTTLRADWAAATDPSGILGYERCITTSAAGADCAGAAIRPWASTGPSLTETVGALSLTNGTTYYSCARATDTLGNVGGMRCSDGITVDTTPPTNPTTVNDGAFADITWNQNATTIQANWLGGGDAGSGIQRWEYCISTLTGCAGTVLRNWITNGVTTSMSDTPAGVTQGQQYFVCVRAFDVAGNASAGSSCSNGQRIDSIAPPATASVNDGPGADIAYQVSATTINANWPAVADPIPGIGFESGLQRYRYCISTSPTGADCAGAATVAWTDNAPLTSATLTRTGLALVNSTTYYVCIRPDDAATNAGTVRCSNGVVIDTGPPAASWTSWTVANLDASRPHMYSPGGNVLWFNPATPGGLGGTATATVTATDPGAGMNRVDFPGLGAGPQWSAGGSDTTVGAGNTWTHDYTMTGGAPIGDPAVNNATAWDNGGAFTGSPALDFDIRADSTAPGGGSMPALSGLQNTTTLVQSIPVGTDGVGSGVSHYVMDAQFAPLYDGACGAWDPWLPGAVLGGDYVGAPGSISNGSVLNFTHHLNDPLPAGLPDGNPEYLDSFCFRTRITVFDAVGNSYLIPENGLTRFDFADPDVSIVGPPDGSAQFGTFNVTGGTNDDWTGVAPEYPNTGSGIDRVTVSYQHTTLPAVNGAACPPITTFSGPWTAHGWTCSWATGALPDGLYTISVQARDRAGNLSTIATRQYLLDNNAPVSSFHSWNDYASPWMHSIATVAWVNPNAPAGAYQLDARVLSWDLGSGMNRVEFPGLGAGWTPGAGVANATFTAPVPAADAFTFAYTFANPASLVAPVAPQATAFDNAGNATPIPFTVRLDGNAPTGVTATVANTRQSGANVTVTLGGGSEPALESGLGSWALSYDTAPLFGDVCGAWTNTWTPLGGGVGIAPATYAHDVTALGSGCYRYTLAVTDNVGNIGSSTPATAQRVDRTAPTVLITDPLDGAPKSGTFDVDGTATDTNTGIDHVRVTWNGPLATTGVICDPAPMLGIAPTWDWDCSWATAALPDGTYTITATSWDLAGNVSATHVISVILDNNPPFVGFHSFVEATPYTYWAGPVGTNNVLWYNPGAPAGSYSFDVLVTATDPAGIARVEYDGAGAGWTPGGAVATQTVPIGPATRYAQTYQFNTAGAVADPPTLDATAFDPANNPGSAPFELTPDTVDPTGGSVTYANGFVGSTAVNVTVATGTDAQSGIAGWELLRSAGTLSGASCIGWGPYSTSVATGAGTYSGIQADTVTDPGCFRYLVRVTDNVGNSVDFTGTTEIMVDLAPPTGSITLTEGALGAQYQHLANPTRLFVNTNAFASGNFNVNVNATAASGILDATFPPLAAGFTGAGVMPGPGPNFVRTYTFAGPAGAPPAGLDVDVRSNSLGPLSLPFEVVADAAAPTGAAPTHTGSFSTAPTVDVTWTLGTDGAGSGIVDHQLQVETGTLAAGACSWNNDWTNVGPVNGPLLQTVPLPTDATCYRFRTQMTDRVLNVGTTPTSAPIMIDRTAPVGASIVLAETVNGPRQWVSAPDTIWVAANPGGASAFTATVTANDPQSGTGAAVFPALGSTFVPTSIGPFAVSYAWNNGALQPGAAPIVQVANGSGLTTTIPFTVNVDGAAPAGATLDQEHGFVTDFLVDLSYATGSDGAGSGIASWRIERRSAVYDIGTDTCAPWLAWGTYPMPTGQPISPYVDSAVAQPTCYQYRLVETDQVGNQTITADGDTAKVINDITPPDAFNLTLPTNPALPAITTAVAAPSCAGVPTYTTATPALTWTPSADAESGLSHYDVNLDGPAVDATIPAPGVTWTPAALADGLHTVGVRAYDVQLNFTNAGPAFPADFRVDTTAPAGSLNAPANGSWTSDTTPTLDWNATDTNCLARVEVYVDGAGAPTAVASGSEGSWTPAAPLADGPHTWRFVAIDTAGNQTPVGPFNFGVDTIDPGPFAITSPTPMTTVRGFVNVAWSASVDAESGIAPAAGYQVLVDGVVRATVADGVYAATIPGLALGIQNITVRAIDRVGNTTDTAPVAIDGFPAILPPLLDAPANNAFVNVVPLLDWHWQNDGGPAPTDYDVVLDGSPIANVLHPTSQYTPAVDPGNGTHTWRISQDDPYTGTVTSVTRTFTIDRTAPLNPGPLTRVATTVSWPVPTDPAAPVASGIDYQEFWIDDGTTQTFSTLSAGTTSRNYGALPDGNYTMWVRAYDNAGNFTNSPTLAVTNDSVPPTAFALDAPPALPALPAITHGVPPAPACETEPTFVGATPTFTWQPSSDATSGLADYDVFLSGPAGTVAAGTEAFTPGAAMTGGAYAWHVVASDNFGLTRSSTPNPMSIRVDAAAPTISYGSPANNSFTTDTTPAFTWTAGDDNCAARVELTVGANVYVVSASAASFTPATVLPEGPTTWSLRVFDSAGNIVSAGAPRTINIDTTPPSGVTATFPGNGATVPEGMLTFDWSDGTDGAGSGISRYEFILDGTTISSTLVPSTSGTHPALGPPAAIDPPTPHTWSIRVFDAVGNSAVFPFTFSASYVADVTPPSPFDLLTPADGAAVPAGTPLTWQAAWDFKGVTQYRVYIDGSLAGTTAGNVTTFTPAAGAGAPICTVSFPAPSAACLTAGAQSFGTGSATSGVGTNWNIGSFAGWSTGDGVGVGDPTVVPITSSAAGFDGPAAWTALEYSTTVPASGADLRFEHRYRMHAVGEMAFDGGTVELMIDENGNGFGDESWDSTCETTARAEYGVTLDCDHEIVDTDGGYTVVMGGANKNAQPLAKQHSFGGTSPGTVQTRMSLAEFAGMDIRIRFRVGMDTCWAGMGAAGLAACADFGAPGVHPAVWRIDNVELADPALTPGVHTWRVEARDAAGNSRFSNQTWTFDLLP